MEPTIHDGEKLTGYPVYRDLRRGDIVVFILPDNPKATSCKRIIGLPGETIEIRDGQVLINGAALSEPYIQEPVNYAVESTTIPENSYYLLGDNRNHSKDSHDFGSVPLDGIQLIVEE